MSNENTIEVHINQKALFYAFQTLVLTLDSKGVLRKEEIQSHLNALASFLATTEEDNKTVESLRTIANYFEKQNLAAILNFHRKET